MRLKLAREWDIGDKIGDGGFGDVYEATTLDPGIGPSVAKLVQKAPGAQRELLFVGLTGIRNVVPIIDKGETGQHWDLVMPRAVKSLAERIKEIGGAFEVAEYLGILTDIATALVDLDGKVVHRDLKPGNVLLLDGKWCLADFGISRDARATTAKDTLKYFMSFPYAAPERWRGERADRSTDIYSLGVIGYELLADEWPFLGPDESDFRHLHKDPPPLKGVPAPLAALMIACLFKSPGARPSPQSVLNRLKACTSTPTSSGRARLRQANLLEAARRSENERRESQYRSEEEKRQELYRDGLTSLTMIRERVKASILDDIPSAVARDPALGGWAITVARDVTLSFTAATSGARPASFSQRQPEISGAQRPPFRSIAYSSIKIRIPTTQSNYEGRSHSLWFCDAHEEGAYRWFETAFMHSPLLGQTSTMNPFDRSPFGDDMVALRPGISSLQVAWPFTPLVDEALEEFVDRRAGWLADAVEGRLQHPSIMPERGAEGSWRR